MQVGIIGGTGPAGLALASRLSASGAQVLVGSREIARAEQVVEELKSSWPDHHLSVSGASNAMAAAAEIVVLATPWEGALQTVNELSEVLEQRVLVSMVNALVRVRREFQPIIAARGSIAATIQAVLPQTAVSIAFQHLPAGDLGALDRSISADVLVCSDDTSAAERTIELVEIVPGLRGLNAGSLASANAIEALTPALLNVNIRYKTHMAIQLRELSDDVVHAP